MIDRKIGDEWLLYRAETSRVHSVNLTAGKVWQLCNGEHSVSQIEDSLKEEFDVEKKDTVQKDIECILTEFKNHKLLK